MGFDILAVSCSVRKAQKNMNQQIFLNKIQRKINRVKRKFTPRNRPKPKTVYWMYGNVCNLKCAHCDVWKVQKQSDFKDVLTLEQKYKLLDNISDWIGKPFALNFFAGEIFLHRDTFDVIKHASGTNAVTSVTTNATLLCTPSQAEKLVLSGLDYVSISLDSFHADFHDANRGMKGVRDRVLKTVRYIQEAKKKHNVKHPQIWLNCIMMKDNLDELILLIRLVKKMKIDGIAFQPIASTSFFGGLEDYDPYWFKKSSVWPEKDKIMAFIDRLEKMKAEGYPIKNSANDFRRFRVYFSDPILFSHLESSDHEIETMVVSREGEFRLTLIDDLNGNLGSVFNDEFDIGWNSKKADQQRDFICDSLSQSKIIPCKKEDIYFV